MRNVSPSTITQQFAEYGKAAHSQRVRELLDGLAAHLHAFVREHHVTHAEWRTALEILTRAGEITSADRNEFVLFSDLLGVSSLVDMINTPPEATSSSVLGPFHRVGAPELRNGADLWRGQPGEPLVVTGQVRDAESGAGIGEAVMDIWQNADNGYYAAQDPEQAGDLVEQRLDPARQPGADAGGLGGPGEDLRWRGDDQRPEANE